MDVICVASDYTYWTNLTRNRNLYVLVLNTLTNLRLLKMSYDFLTSLATIGFLKMNLLHRVWRY